MKLSYIKSDGCFLTAESIFCSIVILARFAPSRHCTCPHAFCESDQYIRIWLIESGLATHIVNENSGYKIFYFSKKQYRFPYMYLSQLWNWLAWIELFDTKNSSMLIVKYIMFLNIKISLIRAFLISRKVYSYSKWSLYNSQWPRFSYQLQSRSQKRYLAQS